MGSFATALEELTLVVFTTLAPAGVCACVIVAVAAMWGTADGAERARLQHMCSIPLFLSMIGLVMSSTHLGTPTNALYVVDGIGRSPLSNEVVACVLFMGSSGMFWLYSFALVPRVTLQKAWTIANAILGVVCVASIALAYNSPTILTWSTPFTPLSVCLEAMAGGPLLALPVFEASAVRFPDAVVRRLIATGFACFITSVVLLVAQYVHLHTLTSMVVAAVTLVPGYPLVLLAYAAAGTIAYGFMVRYVASGLFPKLPSFLSAVEESGSKLAWSVAANALFMAALFAVRFCFYMMHLTYGIGF